MKNTVESFRKLSGVTRIHPLDHPVWNSVSGCIPLAARGFELPFTELTVVDARAVAVAVVVAGVTAAGAARSAASKLALHAERGHLEGRVDILHVGVREEGRGGTWGEGRQARRGARREEKRSGE